MNSSAQLRNFNAKMMMSRYLDVKMSKCLFLPTQQYQNVYEKA